MTEIREEDEGGHRRKVRVSVMVRYDRIMKLLDSENDAIRKYRRELLGSSTTFVSPDIYSLLNLGQELLGDAGKLLDMIAHPTQIRLAAKMIAQVQLKHMVELVQRHDQLQAQKLEKYKQKKPRGKK